MNVELLQKLESKQDKPEVIIVKHIEEAEVDEMWSFVKSKKQQRWLWHAIDKQSGKVLAYTLGSRQDVVFYELQNLLEPFGIKTFYTDHAGVYKRSLFPEEHVASKKNTQQIERKHLTFRTRIKRLARKTICFSKSVFMHDLVIGLFINKFEFGIAL